MRRLLALLVLAAPGAAGAAVSFVGAGAEGTVDSGNVTCGVPGSIANNDVLFAVVYSSPNTAHTCATNCTGWAEAATQTGGTSDGRLSVWWKRTSGSESAPTFSGPANSFTCRMWAFRGVKTSGNPWNVIGSVVAEAANPTFTGDALTPTVADTMMVFVGGAVDNGVWGPAGGSCTNPTAADTACTTENLCADNNATTDNSVFLAYDATPSHPADEQQAACTNAKSLGSDAGRSLSFALEPAANPDGNATLTALSGAGTLGNVSASVAGSITHVQTQSAEATATATSIQVSITTTAGNLLVAYCREGTNDTDTFTVSDSQSQSWTLSDNGRHSPTGVTGMRAGLFYRPASAAVTTVTCSFTTGGGVANRSLIVSEYAGVAASSPVDTTTTSADAATVTSLTSGAFTTTNADDLLVYCVAPNGTSNPYTNGANFTIPTNGSQPRLACQYRSVAQTFSSATTSMSWTTAHEVVSDFVAFKAATPDGAATLTGLHATGYVKPLKGLPQLVQHVSSSTNPYGKGIDGNDFKFTLPNPVLSGNALVLGVAYASSGSFAATPITDTNDTWPTSAAATVTDSNSNMNLAIFVLPNATSGVHTITIHFTASLKPVAYTLSELDHIATTSPANGSAGASNLSAPNLASGSFTPGDNDAAGGNLIWSLFWNSAQNTGHKVTTFAAGSGFQLLDADIAWGARAAAHHASQMMVQGTSASINPGMTATMDTNDTDWVGLSLALKIDQAAGTEPGDGIRIVRRMTFTNDAIGATSLDLQVPSSGNLVVINTSMSSGPNTNITGASDNHSNSYSKNQDDSAEPQFMSAPNATTADDLKVTLSFAGSAMPTMSFTAYDIAGAATAPIDAHAGVPSYTCDNASSLSNHPSITPTTTNGLVIAVGGLGVGPATAVTAPSGALFGFTTYTGENDNDQFNNADIQGNFFNATTAQENWGWTITSQTSNSCSAMAVAYKAAVQGGGDGNATLAALTATGTLAAVGGSVDDSATVAALSGTGTQAAMGRTVDDAATLGALSAAGAQAATSASGGASKTITAQNGAGTQGALSSSGNASGTMAAASGTGTQGAVTGSAGGDGAATLAAVAGTGALANASAAGGASVTAGPVVGTLPSGLPFRIGGAGQASTGFLANLSASGNGNGSATLSALTGTGTQGSVTGSGGGDGAATLTALSGVGTQAAASGGVGATLGGLSGAGTQAAVSRSVDDAATLAALVGTGTQAAAGGSGGASSTVAALSGAGTQAAASSSGGASRTLAAAAGTGTQAGISSSGGGSANATLAALGGTGAQGNASSSGGASRTAVAVTGAGTTGTVTGQGGNDVSRTLTALAASGVQASISAAVDVSRTLGELAGVGTQAALSSTGAAAATLVAASGLGILAGILGSAPDFDVAPRILLRLTRPAFDLVLERPQLLVPVPRPSIPVKLPR